MSKGSLQLLRAGGSLLVELPGLGDVLALAASLRAEPVDGMADAVPAARTVLVRPEPGVRWEKLAEKLEQRWRQCADDPRWRSRRSSQSVTIPVVYDGEDLHEVAQLCDMSADEVVARHTSAEYTVAFTGFAPGFGYLAGGDPALHVPRRTSPRTTVPAGSVGLAGEFSGIYPRSSPGGWQLIGRSDVVLFDPSAESPALLRPGTTVRFEAVQELTGSAGAKSPDTGHVGTGHADTSHAHSGHAAARNTGQSRDAALEVLSPGAQTLLQDFGRPGLADLGVGPSGAMDRGALRRANRLVGNRPEAPGLEHIGGGLSVRADGDLVVAVTGAEVPAWIEGVSVAHSYPLKVADGELLELGAAHVGTYAYLAVRGLDAPAVLGSSSRDVLAGLGPEPVRPGERFAVRARAGTAVSLGELGPPLLRAGERLVLDVVPGPRAHWFTNEALDLLTTQEWQVTEHSNRVGLRLSGARPLERSRHQELPSEPTVRGALQVPTAGQPVLFAADHPLTGGYPVIACVADHHLDLAAQAPPGTLLCFHLTS